MCKTGKTSEYKGKIRERSITGGVYYNISVHRPEEGGVYLYFTAEYPEQIDENAFRAAIKETADRFPLLSRTLVRIGNGVYLADVEPISDLQYHKEDKDEPLVRAFACKKTIFLTTDHAMMDAASLLRIFEYLHIRYSLKTGRNIGSVTESFETEIFPEEDYDAEEIVAISRYSPVPELMYKPWLLPSKTEPPYELTRMRFSKEQVLARAREMGTSPSVLVSLIFAEAIAQAYPESAEDHIVISIPLDYRKALGYEHMMKNASWYTLIDLGSETLRELSFEEKAREIKKELIKRMNPEYALGWINYYQQAASFLFYSTLEGATTKKTGNHPYTFLLAYIRPKNGALWNHVDVTFSGSEGNSVTMMEYNDIFRLWFAPQKEQNFPRILENSFLRHGIPVQYECVPHYDFYFQIPSLVPDMQSLFIYAIMTDEMKAAADGKRVMDALLSIAGEYAKKGYYVRFYTTREFRAAVEDAGAVPVLCDQFLEDKSMRGMERVQDLLVQDQIVFQPAKILTVDDVTKEGGSEAQMAGQSARTIGEAISIYRSSEKPAVICQDKLLTYRELWVAGQRVAFHLLEQGVKKGDRVALLMDRSVDYTAMFLGIALSGAIGVALHKGWPLTKREEILVDCEPALIVDDACAALFTGTDSQVSSDMGQLPEVRPEDPFFIVYTSGSTGHPKGVVNCHEALLNASRSTDKYLLNHFILGNCDRLLVDFNVSYMAFNMFVSLALCNGKCAVLASDQEKSSPAALGECMRRNQVDAIFRPQSLLLNEIRDPQFATALTEVKSISLIGEKVTEVAVQKIRELAPHAHIFCHYGSTEMFGLTDQLYSPGKADLLGQPLGNITFHILDEKGKPVPAGGSGELCVGGLPARLGAYWRDPELNAAKYEIREKEGRIFHTGDLVRMEADKSVRILGRMDDLIKLHGQRIEPGMIEKAFLSFSGIGEAAVVLQSEGEHQYLVGFYTVKNRNTFPDSSIEEACLRRHLAETLPYYMVPSCFCLMDEMPLNASGKLDKKALPHVEGKIGTFIPPKTETEKLLCNLYAKVLKLDKQPGIEDSFFELGGDSISAMTLAYLLEKEGYHAELKWIFAAPAPKLLGPMLEKKDVTPEAGILGQLPDMTEAERIAAERTVGVDRIENIYPLTDSVTRSLENKDSWLLCNFFLFSLRDSPEKLKERFEKMTEAHQALRSVFLFPQEGPSVQAVLRHHDAAFFYTDRSVEAEDGQLISESQRAYLSRLVHFDITRPVDLEKEVLFRAGIIRLSGNTALLYMLGTHLLMDGQSQQQLAHELIGTDVLTPDREKIQNHWRRILYKESATSVSYWKEYENQDWLTILPAPGQEEHTSTDPRKFFASGGSGLPEKVMNYCRWNQVTPAAVLHYLLGRSLCALLGRERCCFLTVSSGRFSDETNLAGMFAHTFPFYYRSDFTVMDCQEQLIRSDEHAWVFESPEKNRLKAMQNNTVVLDIQNVYLFRTDPGLSYLSLSEVLNEKESRETVIRLFTEKNPEHLFLTSAFESGRLYFGSYYENQISSGFVTDLTRALVKEAKEFISDGNKIS